MANELINQVIVRRWRRLGFFCDIDTASCKWKIVGSRNGLRIFRDLLRNFAANQDHNSISEHDYYGPYGFTLLTSKHPSIDEQYIQGTVEDIRRLAEIVAAKLETLEPGNSVGIQAEYVADSPYGLILEMRDDGFDPASADQLIPRRSEAPPK